ncbi:MAG TPA: copper resistance protein CopC [Verrucomicrobiae bacterium]|nr:copper resistance protein CopC [Verrucomicrobiae bacterium]
MKKPGQKIPLWRWIPPAILLLGAPALVWAHAFLYYSVPKAGAVLTNAPAEIKICFTEDLQPNGSTIQVRNSQGREVDRKDSHRGAKDHALLFVSLPKKLPPGDYKVFWHAVAEDGHETEGHFEFTLQ